MEKSQVKDLTEGKPMNLILGFAIPMLLGALFQQFYSMVDTIIVGKFLGVEDLAAVGSTGAINFMVNGFCIGVCSGFAIPVAQKFGARDYHNMRRYVANAGWISLIFAVVMTLVICLLTRNILVWMQTPENILEGAYDYIFIIFLGIPVTFLYNILAGIIRALGDSKAPVYFLVMSSLINIVLDLVTILVMGMGVDGPAYATVISQGISGICCLVFMIKKFKILKMEEDEWRFSRTLAKRICMMGIPMGLQYSITAIGSVILQTAVNGLGTVAVAAVTAAGKVNNFFCCPFEALGGTMATYVGQNVGARKLDRIRQGVMNATVLGAIWSMIALLILFFFGKDITLLFVDASETEVINQAHRMLVCNALFYIALTFVNVWRFSIQGMGFSGFAILAGVCEMVARSVIGFVFVPIFGYIAVCFASPLAWVFADMFLIPAFKRCMGKLKRIYGSPVQ